MEELDTNVSNYTTAELLELLKIVRPNRSSIVEATTVFSDKFADTPALKAFFLDAQRVLLEDYPEAKRTISRLVSVDSYYRETLDAVTDTFTFTLAEKLSGVLSVALYSIEIPYSWYTFAAAKGTTSFVLQTLDATGAPVALPCAIADGNYTSALLIHAVAAELNAKINSLAYPNVVTDPLILSLDPISGKLVISQKVAVRNLPYKINITWFDPNFKYESLQPTRENKHLGWLLGFRESQTVYFWYDGNVTAPSLLTVNPCKSIFVRLNDHLPGRFTNGIVTLGSASQLRAIVDLKQTETTFRVGRRKTDVNTEPGAPRRLTAKQIFSTNSIANSNVLFVRKRDSPLESDLFAKIPLKKPGEWCTFSCGETSAHDDGPTKTIVEFSGPLQLNVREYFSPVTLTTLTVSLYDDRGNLLGLNGLDWGITFLVKQERTQT